ncbi:hypothetical protein B0H11DRAFT_523646 [Mycena galericulata]|nr:hypothetical protein B0H11DRAFT_523646 [Mycena galericulata]
MAAYLEWWGVCPGTWTRRRDFEAVGAMRACVRQARGMQAGVLDPRVRRWSIPRAGGDVWRRRRCLAMAIRSRCAGRTRTLTCGAALHGRCVLNPSLAPCTQRRRWARGSSCCAVRGVRRGCIDERTRRTCGTSTMFLRKLMEARHGLAIRPRCRLREL